MATLPLTTTVAAGNPATGRKSLASAAVRGAFLGMAASIVMAAYAMIASASYQHTGFFTPLYHIASTFVAPTALMTSMQHAMMGSTFYFDLGPAVLGAIIHMIIGAMYGAAFAVIARRLHPNLLVAAGAVWGALAFVVSAWIGLPLAAAIFNSGDQITHMARMVGYGTFLLEHVLFGLALGLMVALGRRPRRSR